MTWNYRVMRRRHAETDSVTYRVCEVSIAATTAT